MLVRLGLLLLLVVLSQAGEYDRAVFVKDQKVLATRDIEPHITNGQTAERGQFPYQIGMYLDMYGFCGGALIDKQWVLTAAHCVRETSAFTVYLGAHFIRHANEPGRIVLETRTAFKHEDNDERYPSNDIALVKLPEAIQPNERIAIIPLPPRSFVWRDFVGQEVRVSGWGKTVDESHSISPVLKFVDLTIISNDKCQERYGSIIAYDIVCASGPGGKSTCEGDSGGPLVIMGNGTNKTIHFAVVSFGHAMGCASGAPSGYIRTYKFLDWIHHKTGIPIQN